MQSDQRMESKEFTEAKQELLQRLKVLEDELNRYLAGEYGIKPHDRSSYEKWLASHKPFHWFIEFYRTLSRGGFDVIVGNPPYLELREVDYIPRNLSLLQSAAVHAMFVERSAQLVHEAGCISMIVPMSLVSTQRMVALQTLLVS